LTGDWDSGIKLARNKDTRDQFAKQSLECAVLLAACKKDEKAREGSQGGLFTQCLLEKIKGGDRDALIQLSYRGLMRLLAISEKCVLVYLSSFA
jgi:hypothetical protein